MQVGRLLVVLAACSGAPAHEPAPTTPAPTTNYRATIRWTGHGIPHVTADELGSLAFGQAYAFATNHVCVLADQIVKLRSERAKLFGPGDHDANITSDFGWLALDVRAQARAALPKLSPESLAVVRGFTAGYNRYLAVTPPSALPAGHTSATWAPDGMPPPRTLMTCSLPTAQAAGEELLSTAPTETPTVASDTEEGSMPVAEQYFKNPDSPKRRRRSVSWS